MIKGKVNFEVGNLLLACGILQYAVLLSFVIFFESERDVSFQNSSLLFFQ